MEEIERISEEGRFRNDAELIRFIEAMNGNTWEQMTETCLFLSKYRPEEGRNYWDMYMDIYRNFLIIGGFMMRIDRRSKGASGNGIIHVFAEQQIELMTCSEKKRLLRL